MLPDSVVSSFTDDEQFVVYSRSDSESEDKLDRLGQITSYHAGEDLTMSLKEITTVYTEMDFCFTYSI